MLTPQELALEKTLSALSRDKEFKSLGATAEERLRFILNFLEEIKEYYETNSEE